MRAATKNQIAWRENKKWKIVADDTLVDALLPGLSDAINSIG